MGSLSDILAILKPESYLTAGIDAGGEWAIQFGDRPGTIKCHAVTAGACWLAVNGLETPVQLLVGDRIVLPNGRPFTLANNPLLNPAEAHDVLTHARPGDVILHNGGVDFAFAGTRFEMDRRKAGARPSGGAVVWRESLPDEAEVERRIDAPEQVVSGHVSSSWKPKNSGSCPDSLPIIVASFHSVFARTESRGKLARKRVFNSLEL